LIEEVVGNGEEESRRKKKRVEITEMLIAIHIYIINAIKNYNL
jgi:ribosome-associated protein YbcJ (S4-like RNA binding protein)